MKRALLAVGFTALLLAGCAGSVRQNAPQRYLLTLPAAPAGSVTARARARRGTLRVARISAPLWLAGKRFDYRLLYQHSDRVAAYALSDWAAPPARMLAALLRRSLARSGAFAAVLGPDDAAHADLDVQIHIEDFSQAFTSPQQSSGVLDATATLIDVRTGAVAGQRHFAVRVPAATPDAAGGAAALNQASARFAQQLGDWLDRVAPITHP